MSEWLIAVGALVLLTLALWPRIGLFARWQATRQLAERRQSEDALKHMLHCESNRTPTSVESLSGALQISPEKVAVLLQQMEDRGLISYAAGGLRLESSGRELALHIIRAHRLWESYLADQTGVQEKEWHHRAELQEHLLSRRQIDDLAARLGNPLRDPHGDVIPDEGGPLEPAPGQSLNAAPLHEPFMITHIEDEPENVYARLVALGLQPGMKVVVDEKTPQQINFRADGIKRSLPPVLANNLSVSPMPETAKPDLAESEPLAALQPGERAKVAALSHRCRGPERRRLLDLGFVPGTLVAAEMVSPAGDPTAYRVRGAVIALRREQAAMIRVVEREAA